MKFFLLSTKNVINSIKLVEQTEYNNLCNFINNKKKIVFQIKRKENFSCDGKNFSQKNKQTFK